MKRLILFFVLFLFLCRVFTNAQALPDCENGKCFNIDSLSTHIIKTLKGNCTGFGFVIYKDGVLKKEIHFGHKRLKADGGAEPFDLISKMHIASMSKTITAICVLRQLAHDNLSTYTPISEYLPKNWVQGPNVDKITFRRLMRHEAGIRITTDKETNGETFEQLKGKMQEGVIADSIDVAQYQNMDFAMMRILLPRLEGFNLPENKRPEFVSEKYINFVKENIFKPCDLTDANTFPSETDPVHNYNWPYKGGHGQLFYDYTLSCGAYGWYLSVSDYGKIINKLFNTEELLNTAWRDTMTSNELGCFAYKGKHGNYYWHNGGWEWYDA